MPLALGSRQVVHLLLGAVAAQAMDPGGPAAAQ